MKRRAFITLLGGAALAAPLAAHAQQSERIRRIAWLDLVPESDPGARARVTIVRQGLEKLGWVVGRNLAIDYRWGAFDVERASRAGAELLDMKPDVILCGGSPAVQALQQANRTVPIIFVLVAEPVAQGFIQSLAQPGGNTTGFSYLEPTVGAKWLELLKEIAPRLKRVAYVYSPKASPYAPLFYKSIEAAAAKLAVQMVMSAAQEPADLETILAGLPADSGVIFNADAFILTNRKMAIELAARHRVPAIYGIPTSAAEGGLIYYGLDIFDQYRQAVAYVDRILKGEKPADLPVQQPTKFQFAINLQTAKTLGLTVPNTILVSADEVIE